jgi:hypothetical protein
MFVSYAGLSVVHTAQYCDEQMLECRREQVAVISTTLEEDPTSPWLDPAYRNASDPITSVYFEMTGWLIT